MAHDFAKLADVTRGVIWEHLPYGSIGEIDVEPGTDTDGQPVLNVMVHLRCEIGARTMLGMSRILRDRLPEGAPFPAVSFRKE